MKLLDECECIEPELTFADGSPYKRIDSPEKKDFQFTSNLARKRKEDPAHLDYLVVQLRKKGLDE